MLLIPTYVSCKDIEPNTPYVFEYNNCGYDGWLLRKATNLREYADTAFIMQNAIYRVTMDMFK